MAIPDLKYHIIFFILILSGISCGSDQQAEEIPAYHSPDSLESALRQINQSYPNITALEPAGYSAEGRTIWSISISDNPTQLKPEPKIRLIGAIHGDENATTEILLRTVVYLVSEYSNGNTIIRNLVDNRHITIIPMMNPDGVVYNTRENADNVDLNRNFSVQWAVGPDHGSGPFSEPESSSIKNFSSNKNFNTSLCFHTGAVIVNMPFDYMSEHIEGVRPLENELVNFFALQYSRSGRFLESPGLLSGNYVTDGIINGGDWYTISGSLQDWSYLGTGCLDFTIEITIGRPETNAELDELFGLNRDSILAYIESSGIGIYGKISNSSDNPVNAVITIDNGDLVMNSDINGFYHRILLPGNYIVTFTAAGYNEYSTNVSIIDATPVPLNVTMTEM